MTATILRNQFTQSLITPEALFNEFPVSMSDIDFIKKSRDTVANILTEKDPRFLVIVGPCSIHDPASALEYAALLKSASENFSQKLFIIMRVYFEKPRTTLGWKGLISDPFLDGSFNMNHGLKAARKLLLKLAEIKIPAATEFVDPLLSHYYSDLITWGCIGARTSESQIHRELASGLEFPIGFKNTTDGNFKIAIDGAHVASHSHYFLSLNKKGLPTIIKTQGNPFCHIVLRGSQTQTNFHTESVQEASALLKQNNLLPKMIIDCSHGNSLKNYERQTIALNAVLDQIRQGSKSICGVMLESHLQAGKQPIKFNEPLVYGQSITDACLSWEETLPLLETLCNTSRSKS
jgi:3-deoxy-7-phosphoheptulonate synthase